MGISKKIREYLKDGFFRGIGWAFGVTVGFAIISTVLIMLLNALGGLPVIGEQIAGIVEATQDSLHTRNIFEK